MKAVRSEGAPSPIGPYSQGAAAGGTLLFISGQTPKHPKTGEIPAGIKDQTALCIENIRAIAEAAGASLSDVVRVGVFLRDMSQFSAFNEVYARFFKEPYPARTTVQAVLPGGDAVLVEMDAVAVLPKSGTRP